MTTVATEGRTCTRCGEWKESARFKRVPGTDRLRSNCRTCNVAETRERRARPSERACVKCGMLYQTRNGESVCCPPCGLAARLGNLTNPPKATLVCQQCGRSHQPGNLSRQFCSRACKGMASRNKPTAKRGKKFPEHQRAAVRDCLTCGSQFRAVKDTKKIQQVYCSHRCYLKNRRVSLVESRLADMLRSRGLPVATTVQLGRWTYDVAVVGTRLLVEFDGTYWHSSAKVQERDRRKDEWCLLNGYTLIRVPEADFRRDPEGAADVILRRAEAEGLDVRKEG